MLFSHSFPTLVMDEVSDDPAQAAGGTGAVEGAAGASEQTDPTGEPAADGGDGAVSEPPAYTPNLKFKVYDKEHEFDEFVRGVIDSEDKEKRVRELYEKAYGLDMVKPKYKELRDRYQTVNTEFQELVGDIQRLKGHYQKGDFDTFFKTLGIPEEKVLNWLVQKVQYQQLPPEERAQLDAQRAAEQRAMAAEQQLAQYQEMTSQQQSQAKAHMLQLALERPEIKQFAQAFDAMGLKDRTGQPLSFVDEVINRGELAWYTRQQDLTPEEAIREVMQLYAHVTQSAQPALAAQVGGSQAPAPQQKPQVIPKVGGRTGSPTPAKPKSIEDLKKIYAEMSS